MHAPDRFTNIQWVNDTCKELDPTIIVKYFKLCSISNAFDGTVDNILWTDEAIQLDITEDVTDDNRDSDDKDDLYYIV